MMRRRVVSVGVFALIGALVNVLVGWGAMVVQATDTPTHLKSAKHFDRGRLAREGIQTFENMDEITARFVGFVDRAYIVKFDRTIGLNSAFLAQITQCGWPLLSMEGMRWSVIEEDPDSHEYRFDGSGMHSRALLKVRDASSVPGELDSLPLRAKWPGFGLNTAIYAIAVWSVWTVPGMMKRTARRIRGRCAWCGYELARSGVQHERCPECGKAVGAR